MGPTGKEPASLRLVAQYLNHLRHRMPQSIMGFSKEQVLIKEFVLRSQQAYAHLSGQLSIKDTNLAAFIKTNTEGHLIL
jgi:hypothetical protein